MNNFVDQTTEEVREHLINLDRKAFSDVCAQATVKNSIKIIEALVEEFKMQAGKFVEKKNKTAALKSRKVSGMLDAAFLSWRKKSIEASKNLKLLEN